MKIIINQDKEVRLVGYDETKGCENILDIDFYISKELKVSKPIHCQIGEDKHLLLIKEGTENYNVYKILDFMNVSWESGDKELFIFDSNNELEIKLTLLLKEFSRNSFKSLLRKG